jgi:HSP20 family molecular chaperone IbpA
MNLIESFLNTYDNMKPENPVLDAGDVYKMELELAGFGKEDVKIKVLDDILYVNAKNKDRSQKFRLHLNNSVSDKHIDAELKNGLLKLTLPKRAVAESTEIEIKT